MSVLSKRPGAFIIPVDYEIAERHIFTRAFRYSQVSRGTGSIIPNQTNITLTSGSCVAVIPNRTTLQTTELRSRNRLADGLGGCERTRALGVEQHAR